MYSELNIKILGLCGSARSGKDSFFQFSKDFFNKSGLETKRVAFADALKEECNEFLKLNMGISAFTEDPVEKALIRPFLVTYGTHLRRAVDEYCWIKKVKPVIEESLLIDQVPVITDVRYLNEVKFVQDLGGVVIHLSRQGTPPANEEEAEMEPILKNAADINLSWPTLNGNKEDFMPYIRNTLMNFSNELESV